VSPAPDLSPHPLITALGTRVGAAGPPLQAAGAAFDAALGPVGAPIGTMGPIAAGAPAGVTAAIAAQRGTPKADDVANELAQDPNVPELDSFAGYLGGVAGADPAGADWRLFYFDSKLRTWLLVEENAILFRDAIQDDKSPFGQRDVIWVDSRTSVSHGSGALPLGGLQARFLRGELISAGDFKEEADGGTLSVSTGIFCEARSVGCCRHATK
jgi:hypothetical protein